MIIKDFIDIISLTALPLIIIIILTVAIIKKVSVYETFIEGAKEGIKVSFNILPYLTAIIVAISMLRASGALDSVALILNGFFTKIHMSADVFPLAIVRSLSGSAAIGVFSDIVSNNNINSYTTKLAAIMLGSSETTFYVLTVYFGSVSIKKYRYALITGLIADIAGIIMSIIVANFFWLK